MATVKHVAIATEFVSAMESTGPFFSVRRILKIVLP